MLIDYSSKHHILFRNREDGSLQRMDQPFYTARAIADGVWMIQSEGCNSYLVEGGNEAVLIDTGYGCGNIRTFCESITAKPVRRVINTHDHFDHSALDGYFESAIMSAKTAPLATKPFPSFEGVDFPQNYRKEIVKDGDTIDLGNRRLTFFETPDHAVGSIMILDESSGILFVGDEVQPFGKGVNGYVDEVYRQFAHVMEYRDRFQWICGGHQGKSDADIIDRITKTLAHILNGEEGELPQPRNFRLPEPEEDGQGNVIWMRDVPHPGDVHPKDHSDDCYQRSLEVDGCRVQYDCRKIRKEP